MAKLQAVKPTKPTKPTRKLYRRRLEQERENHNHQLAVLGALHDAEMARSYHSGFLWGIVLATFVIVTVLVATFPGESE